MIDATAIIMILGFIGTIGTMAGVAFWLDKKQTARMDRIEKRFDDQDERQRAMQIELAEVKADVKAHGERLDRQDERFDRIDQRFERQDGRIDRQDGRFDRIDERFDRIDERFERQSVEINAVGRKVDRVEGMVYVLIHGPEYRGRGTASEAESEEPISEPVGDD